MDGGSIKVKQKYKYEYKRKQTIDAIHPIYLLICEKY